MDAPHILISRPGIKKKSYRISLGQLDDYDITWVNGRQSGRNFRQLQLA